MSHPAVLVFGTDRHARHALQRAISSQGFPVLLASSAAEAAKCMSTGRVRVVVMSDALHMDTAEREPREAAELSFQQADNIAVVMPYREPGDSSEAAAQAVIAAVRAALTD